MERKIGEIFEHNGEWYQCVKGDCTKCDFFIKRGCVSPLNTVCGKRIRKDKQNVIFKKLEKVGEPFSNEYFGLVQKYELKMYGYSTKDKRVCFADGYDVFIKIEQTKEDMKENEENKYDGKMDKECIPLCDALNSLPDVETTESCCGHCKDRFRIFFKCKNPYSLSVIARVFNRRYSGTKLQWIIEVETHDNGGYNYFVHSVEAYENNTMMEKDISQLVENIKHWSSEKYKEHFINEVTNEEKKKLNLKPFNLEEAKQGKPVCTRGGKPARIICWNKLGGFPIIALVMDGNNEFVFYYNENGRTNDIIEKYYDLMMLPKKHEGWINVYKGGKLDADCIYPTKEDAVENIFQPMKDKYIDTINIEWEE